MRNLGREVAYRAALLVVISVANFAIVHATPGDPCRAAQVADAAARADQERVCREFHLDRPFVEQLWRFHADLASGELRSWKLAGRPRVLWVVGRAFSRTMPIVLLVTLLVWTTAFPIGVQSASRPGGWFDRTVGTISLIILSVPSFLVAYAIVAVAGTAGIPQGDGSALRSAAGWLWHAAMPSAAIAAGAIAFLGRYVRAQMIAISREPFIDLARLRGLPPERVYYRHALRNALMPAITLFGLYLPWIVSGSLVVELVFAWPGLGRLAYDAFLSRDYPVVLAVNLFTAFFVLLGGALAEVAYRLADPRTRHQRGSDFR